jgi:hypothetical protein
MAEVKREIKIAMKEKFVIEALLGCRATFRNGISDTIDALKSGDKLKIQSQIGFLKKKIGDTEDILAVAEELLTEIDTLKQDGENDNKQAFKEK